MNPAPPSELARASTPIVKAYDVRGLVGEELTGEIVEALAAGFVDEVGAAGAESSSATTCATRRPAFAAAFARGARRAAAPTSWPSACARPTRPTSPPASMRRAGGDVHREPQPGRLQRHQVLPRRRPGHLARHRPRGHPRPRAATTSSRASRMPRRPAPYDGRRARRLRRRTSARSSTCPASARCKIVVDAGNGMGGLTVPAVLGDGRRPPGAAARDRPALLRARRHLPQPRGEPARAGEPRRPAARRGRARRRPRARLRRRRRSLLRGRRAGRRGEPVGGRRDRRAARDRTRARRRRGATSPSSTT